MKVYQAIATVQGELAKVGIAKASRNTQQGYQFRGIDDIYAALSPLLAAHGLVILPRILERNVVERATAKGGALFYVTVKAEFDFVASEDGSKHTVATFGEAMDSGDKATNKAMSAAYKYAALMAFAIPTEGDNDADMATHDVAARDEPKREEVFSGPHKTKTALDAAIKQLISDMGTVSTMREWYVLKNESATLIAQIERDRPHWFNGWEAQPDGFIPVRDRIAKLESDLANIEGPGE